MNTIINHFESSRKTLIIIAVYITSVSIDRLLFNNLTRRKNLFLWNDCIMSQSIPAVPIPPPPGISICFKKLGKFPVVGTHKRSKCLGVGTKKKSKCPAPGTVGFQHLGSFFINQRIKRSTFQYFNAMV